MIDVTPAQGLWSLFIAAFVSATLLPGGSEIVLLALIQQHPELLLPAVGTASAGNSLGGLVSFWMGRLIPRRAQSAAIDTVRKAGYWVLLFSWLPVVGDPLCVAAGWLRMNPWLSALMFTAGKTLRFAFLVLGWMWFQPGTGNNG